MTTPKLYKPHRHIISVIELYKGEPVNRDFLFRSLSYSPSEFNKYIQDLINLKIIKQTASDRGLMYERILIQK